jgi:tRNA pseudouridine-54 N-methylase
MALNSDVFKERHIILLCNNVSEDVGKGVFRPNNLLEGRVDVICRCIANALFFSNGVRR